MLVFAALLFLGLGQFEDATRRREIGAAGKIVYTASDGTVWVRDLAGEHEVRTKAPACRSFVWFEDGTRFVGFDGRRLHLVDAASGDSMDVAESAKATGSFSHPTPSPDGRRVAVLRIDVAERSALGSIVVFDVSTKTLREVGTLRDGHRIADVRRTGPQAWWAPDGALFAVVDGDAEEFPQRLVRADFTTGETKTLREFSIEESLGIVAFHGSKWAYSSEQNYESKVRDSTGQELFSDADDRFGFDRTITDLTWAPDGAALFVSLVDCSRRQHAFLVRIEPGKEPVQVAKSADAISLPTWSSDGSWCVVTLGRGESFDVLWADARLERSLPLAIGEVVHDRVWFVDDAIVHWRIDEGDESTYEVGPRKRTIDLWALDAKSGRDFQLTVCGFEDVAWRDDAEPYSFRFAIR